MIPVHKFGVQATPGRAFWCLLSLWLAAPPAAANRNAVGRDEFHLVPDPIPVGGEGLHLRMLMRLSIVSGRGALSFGGGWIDQ